MSQKTVSELNYYELLNLSIVANANEIQQSYLHLTSVYSEGSHAVYGALNEDERGLMVKNIQKAFETLINPVAREKYDTETLMLNEEERKKIYAEKSNDQPNGGINGLNNMSAFPLSSDGAASEDNGGYDLSKTPSTAQTISGSHLRDIRIAKGASLNDISDRTKVKKSYLEAIEREDVKSFPAPVFMKGFLKAYAKALGLDPNEVSQKYLAKD